MEEEKKFWQSENSNVVDLDKENLGKQVFDKKKYSIEKRKREFQN